MENLSPSSRQQSATNFFLQGFNCCQSVLLAFSDILKVDQETLKTIASGFGGGMGRLREVCGAFSAMVMMAGFISPAADPSIKEDRTAEYYKKRPCPIIIGNAAKIVAEKIAEMQLKP